VKLLAYADRGCRLGVSEGCWPSRLSQGEAGGRRPSGFSQGEMEPPPRWAGCLLKKKKVSDHPNKAWVSNIVGLEMNISLLCFSRF
jgi:hypothetical protein